MLVLYFTVQHCPLTAWVQEPDCLGVNPGTLGQVT